MIRQRIFHKYLHISSFIAMMIILFY